MLFAPDLARTLGNKSDVFRDTARGSMATRRGSAVADSGADAATVNKHSSKLRQPTTGNSRLGGAMGLKEFIHRTRVLGLYRGILKVSLWFTVGFKGRMA